LRMAERVAERSPGAWFVNFTNPAGLVTEALLRVLGDRVVGICDSPTALCARVAAVLRRPMSSLRFHYGGLNHLGWVTAVQADGHDLLPALVQGDALESIDEARLLGLEDVRSRGIVPNEYLVYLARTEDVVRAFRDEGSRAQLLWRQQAAFYGGSYDSPEAALAAWRAAKEARHGTYMAEARASASSAKAPVPAAPDDEGPGEAGYAAIAAAFVRAVGADLPTRLILDMRNRGTLPFLDDVSVVEVPCLVDASGPRPQPVRGLPAEESDLVERIKVIERLTIEAATTCSAAHAIEAMAMHPVVPSRETAERIFDGYRARHTWLRERFR
jgi:6-phospho-beta-glucosidase